MYSPLRLIIAIAIALVLAACAVKGKSQHLSDVKQSSVNLIHIGLAKNDVNETELDIRASFYTSGLQTWLDGSMASSVDCSGAPDPAFALGTHTVALADVFEALASMRPDMKSWTVALAMDLPSDESGAPFDPDLARLLLSLTTKYTRVMQHQPDYV